jgi:putative ABC transport system permease protein
LLSKEVINIILISSLIAFPVAYFGAKYWLEGFADKAKVSMLIYLSATLITLVIGWLSISYQTIKAANRNPANALRIE